MPFRRSANFLLGAAISPFALLAAPAFAQDVTGPIETPEMLRESEPGAALERKAQSGAAEDFWASYDGISEEETVPEAGEPGSPFSIAAPESDDQIAFEADELGYEMDDEIISASGNVVLRRADQELHADTVRWNRNTGEIVASGNVRLTDTGGNKLYTEELTLTDELAAGAMENLLLVLTEGQRMAARTGQRMEDGRIRLTDAAYSPCPVTTDEGCAKDPSWRFTATRVDYDPETQVIRFRGAMLELFGAPLIPLPGLSVRADGQPVSGIGTPNLRFSASNGVEIENSYYWRIAANRELTLGANIYTDVWPMLSASYKALTADGAYQITGYATSSTRIPIGDSTVQTSQKDLRGYFDANGRFHLDDNWSVTASIRVASDRTFLRRYDISRDDRLRSMINVERIDDDSYLSFSGWMTQTLRAGDEQGLVPLALPVIDYRRRIADPVLGGQIMLQANSLALTRTDGQDTQRAFAKAEWNLRRYTPWGQVVELTALGRADVYHSDENALTSVELYRGTEGWQARGVVIGAIDVKYPLTGAIFGGTQVFTPRVQLVATPDIKNLDIPNEDARAIDLEDSNLFALNRFPGYDRVEEGVRFTYGFDWRWNAPGWQIDATLGQSYRLSDAPILFPDGTGLTSRTSDIVGRTEVRWRNFIKVAHRFRLDKDNLAVRRNELDFTVGSNRTYVEAGYLRLNRDIPDTLEDLRDREELRIAGRLGFQRYWSLFGAAVINLTDKNEDPTNTSDGFDPLRTRLGLAYEDDCLELGVTWRRDAQANGDARKGNTFLFRFRLKNIGFN